MPRAKLLIMLKSLLQNQFFRFLVAGGIAAVINFIVGYALAGKLPWHGDIVIGYLAGMITAFFMFERLVFGEHAESRRQSAIAFVGVNLLGLLQTWIIYVLLVNWAFPVFTITFYPGEIARACAIITPTITSFIGHKYFTFRQ